MTFPQYEKKFRVKAIKSGFSEYEISACLLYAKPLIESNLPVIFNTANFGALVGYKTNYLKRAVKYTPYFYRAFTIRKKNGGSRELVEPLPSLKEIQTWILENILREVKVSKYAKAYVKSRTLLENVRYHKGREAVLTLDIENFFGSITLLHIEHIFLGLGYSSNISNLLAKLCTYEGVLAQGAPTSPYLSNLYLRRFDEIISKFCNQNDIRYTRYADDLTFSGQKDALDIVEFIRKTLQKFSLKLNKDKEKLMVRNQRQVVTGIVVNEKLQIPKAARNFIRNEIFFIKKFGLDSHLEKTDNKKSHYLEHLIGKINFALHINPNDLKMQSYKSIVLKIYQSRDEDKI
ncbi:reverse transcriptase family protein [Chitinophaga sp. S165]|uniref:reverse transcriptase family protein n=1 Tax=Chitinophaga sp. S165 TaxID=2135462 RepID=UPI000D7107DA|nr:reverse transcriptase family protein [Chitinophaga sp. S165]PWV44624.1 RNA-directed DNA polymerase [Chitinophaga sp. S165]